MKKLTIALSLLCSACSAQTSIQNILDREPLKAVEFDCKAYAYSNNVLWVTQTSCFYYDGWIMSYRDTLIRYTEEPVYPGMHIEDLTFIDGFTVPTPVRSLAVLIKELEY